MKKTAIQWLINELSKNGYFKNGIPVNIVNQSKQIEKGQIMDAYLKNHLQGCWMNRTAEEYAEEYFNETFKANDHEKQD